MLRAHNNNNYKSPRQTFHSEQTLQTNWKSSIVGTNITSCTGLKKERMREVKERRSDSKESESNHHRHSSNMRPFHKNISVFVSLCMNIK